MVAMIVLFVVGVISVAIAVVLMFADWNKQRKCQEEIESKKRQLVEAIEDSDSLIQEMNKFADYVTDSLDKKERILEDSIKRADSRIEALNLISRNVFTDEPRSDVGSAAKDLPLPVKAEKAEKVLSINTRHREVITLANKGLNDTDIAKTLNMGKGEIQLILGVNKKKNA